MRRALEDHRAAADGEMAGDLQEGGVGGLQVSFDCSLTTHLNTISHAFSASLFTGRGHSYNKPTEDTNGHGTATHPPAEPDVGYTRPPPAEPAPAPAPAPVPVAQVATAPAAPPPITATGPRTGTMADLFKKPPPAPVPVAQPAAPARAAPSPTPPAPPSLQKPSPTLNGLPTTGPAQTTGLDLGSLGASYQVQDTAAAAPSAVAQPSNAWGKPPAQPAGPSGQSLGSSLMSALTSGGAVASAAQAAKPEEKPGTHEAQSRTGPAGTDVSGLNLQFGNFGLGSGGDYGAGFGSGFDPSASKPADAGFAAAAAAGAPVKPDAATAFSAFQQPAASTAPSMAKPTGGLDAAAHTAAMQQYGYGAYAGNAYWNVAAVQQAQQVPGQQQAPGMQQPQPQPQQPHPQQAQQGSAAGAKLQYGQQQIHAKPVDASSQQQQQPPMVPYGNPAMAGYAAQAYQYAQAYPYGQPYGYQYAYPAQYAYGAVPQAQGGQAARGQPGFYDESSAGVYQQNTYQGGGYQQGYGQYGQYGGGR